MSTTTRHSAYEGPIRSWQPTAAEAADDEPTLLGSSAPAIAILCVALILAATALGWYLFPFKYDHAPRPGAHATSQHPR